MNKLYAATCHYKINVHDLVSLLQFYAIMFNEKNKYNLTIIVLHSIPLQLDKRWGATPVHPPISPQLKVTVGNTIDKYYYFKFYGCN